MKTFEIKRGGALVASVRGIGTLTTRILGESVVDMSFTLPTYIEFLTGDTVDIEGEGTFILTVPNFEELGKRRYEYSLKFVAEHYLLANTQFMFYDSANTLTKGDFFMTGKLQDFVEMVVKNANRNLSGWVMGAIQDTEYKNLSFNNDNCLGVLTRLSDEFGIEFWVQGRTINFSKKGATSGLSFRYGKGNGLRSLSRNESDQKPVTRLYVFGSEQNLPKDYRSLSRRLLMPEARGLSLEKNIDKYGVNEHTEFFDIKPEREGIVTEVADKNTFSDSTLDFNIIDYHLGYKSPKIHFNTGQLAGYTFEIRENGYNHATRTITINQNQDETAWIVPNELAKPAVGDKYVLIDIAMPSTYVSAAEQRLYEAAQDWIDQNSVRKVIYVAETDPLHLKRNSIKVNLGDYVNIASVNAGIDTDIRVTGRIVDLQNSHNQQLELADDVNISDLVQQTFYQRKVERAIDRNRLDDAARSRMNWRTSQETLNMIFDPETGKMDGDKIEARTITAQHLTVGTTSQNFQLRGIVFKAGFEGDNTKFAWTAGSLIHNIYEENGGIWNIDAGVTTGLVVSNAYYVYAKCDKTSQDTTIEITEDRYTVDEFDGFYTLWIGVLNSVVDSYRTFSTTYGLTTINGAMITAGFIKNTLGDNVLDIDNRTFYGEFKIKGTGVDVGTELTSLATTASEAEIAANTAAAQATSAQSAANIANEALEDIASDDIITPNEKQRTKNEWGVIVSEKPTITAQAVSYGVTTATYTAKYNALDTYVTPLLADMATNSVIDGDEFRLKFGEYYEERTKLLKAVSDAAKVLADAAQAAADNAAQNALEAKNYIDNTLPQELSDIWAQLDGVIQSWFDDHTPTLANEPAVNWTTDAEKNDHLGDLFYNSTTGTGYRFVKNGTVYSWVETSGDVAAALALAQEAKDTADGKRRVFVAQPTTPYDAGDLWAQGPTGDLMRCISGRQTGSYTASDWTLSSKYTDDTVANQAAAEAASAASAANNAQNSANTANSKLSDIASDSKLTPSEKQATKKEWDTIQGETALIEAQADKYGIGHAAYTSAYTTLDGYITPLLSNLGTTSNITGATFRTRFSDYYNAKVALLKAISDEAKEISEAIENMADLAVSAAAQAEATANAAQSDANAANNKLADIASDSKLTPSEKQATKKEWDIIQGEKTIIQAQASKYSISSSTYTSRYNTLDSYITPLLSNLGATSSITGTDFRTRFSDYYDAKVALLRAISDKAKDIADAADAKADAAQTAAAQAVANANQAKTTAERAAEVTDYLFTTINDVLVATGTFLVGNAAGNNAGITGVGSSDDSVFLWGGSTFANRNSAPSRFTRSGEAVFSKIKATGGEIAGFTISGDSLRSGSPWTYGGQYVSISPGDLLFRKVGGSTSEVIELGFGYAGLGQYDGLRVKNTISNTFGTNRALELSAKNAFTNIALEIQDGDFVTAGALYEEGIRKVSSTTTCNESDRVIITTGGHVYLPANARKGRTITVTSHANGTRVYANSGNGSMYNAAGGTGSFVEFSDSSFTFRFDGSNWYTST